MEMNLGMLKYCLLLISALALEQCAGQGLEHPNILMLVSDDMRPEISAFHTDQTTWLYPYTVTPNLDALASRSLVLQRAYVQQAVCSPSRISTLTGRRPDTTHVYDQWTHWRNRGGNFSTVMQYFKDNGYYSVGMGKIFHLDWTTYKIEDPLSWSEDFMYSHYWQSPLETLSASWKIILPEDREERPLEDDLTTENVKETLRRLAPAAIAGEQPFFLAAGFERPHLPFWCPEEFFDLHPKDLIDLPNNPFAPVDMPEIAWSTYYELRLHRDIFDLGNSGGINDTLPDDVTLDLRRAYYACVSYVDHLVGEILGELESLGLADDTIVAFWGDHGWHLGENAEWTKQTNFELGTHAPMMISIPGRTDQGAVTHQLTEYVDLFPTLVEAAGLEEVPLCPEDSSEIEVCHEGQSLLPLIEDPERPDWKDAAFSQFPRPFIMLFHNWMGHTMRTDRFRYTEWPRWERSPIFSPDWDDLNGVELYDLDSDPEGNQNLADHPDYAEVRQELSVKLRAGWRGVLPETP